MTSVSFIGLGIMGRPMASNLVRAGFDVTGYSRSESSRQRARESGVPVVDRLDDLPTDSEVVVTMLPDGPDVVAVLLGEHGMIARQHRLSTFIDMSTIAPETSREIAMRLTERGHRALDAPVSGGEGGAIEGTLAIMVGGEADVVDDMRPVLQVLGSTIVHVGGAGAGQVVKAANQLIIAGNLQMIAEALVFIDAHDVALESAIDVLSAGLAGSALLTRKRAELLQREFRPGFRLELHHKDLGIATRAAREVGVPLPASSVVAQLVQSLVSRGDGALDHSALYQLALELAGRDSIDVAERGGVVR